MKSRFFNSLRLLALLPVLGLTAAAPLVGGARKAVQLFQERLSERIV